MTNLFEHTSAYWAKYADYEWRTSADGKDYLLPTPDAEASVYNPIPLADQLVLDAINIGLLVMHKSPKDRIKDAIHHFACTYGLLGLMTALPTTPNCIEYEKVGSSRKVRLSLSLDGDHYHGFAMNGNGSEGKSTGPSGLVLHSLRASEFFSIHGLTFREEPRRRLFPPLEKLFHRAC